VKVHGKKEDSIAQCGPLIDEALTICAEMKKNLCTINRHVSIDSTGKDVKALDSIASYLSLVQRELDKQDEDEAGKSALTALHALSQRITGHYPKPSLFKAPLLTVSTFKYIFWNDHYLRPYEKDLENNSLFASYLRPRVQYVRYILFGDLGDKGIAGKGGWFFYRPDVEFLIKPSVIDPRSIVVDPNDKPVSDNPVKAIGYFKDQLAQMNIDLLVVIIPGKPSIYPDLVSGAIRPDKAGSFSPSLHMIDTLRKNGIEAIDLYTPLSRERAFDAQAGDSLYLQKDTHWKARGVRAAAREVARRIKRYPWYRPGNVEYAIDSIVVDRMGDVGVMTTLPSLKTGASLKAFAPEKAKCYKVFRVERDAKGNETGRMPYKDDFRTSQVLLLGDSFSRIYQTDQPHSAGWISHIAFELSQPIASIVNDGGASTLVRQSLARRVGLLKGKKLVVWEIVERDFRFGEEGWKEVPFSTSTD
jgi:hypothetical protein